MSFTTYLNRMEAIDRMIRLKCTGTPSELSYKLGISPSSLYELIKLMKGLGGPIYYCRKKRSYCYHEEVRLELMFRPTG
ncbi:MAG: hypothetical protein ACFB10_05075 [Salibacteraceae bacterium]